jgi:hypothetical protein
MGAGGIEGYLLSAAVALPLCLRRRYPLVVLVAIALLFFTAGERVPVAFFANVVTQAALFMAIYAATAWAPDRRRLKVTMIVVVVGMFSWLFYGFVKALQNDAIKGLGQGLLSPYVSYVILNIGINVAYFFGAYFWGRTAWRTARQHDELERQAAELAAQQQANARRAVIDERLRISRELHDVVAHHISSIGVQAGGARRVVDTDPEASKAALSVIEESSRTAVNEMRQLLGMLRAADPDLDEEVGAPAIKAPQAGANRLPGLFVLGFVALAGLWAVAGSLATRQKDLGSTTLPGQMILMIPFFFSVFAGSQAKAIASFVPIASSMSMPGRMLTEDVPAWEPLLAILILLVATVLIVRVAARLYERTLLQTGRRMGYREAISIKSV